MTDCQWERFRATRAPMHSQQRQIGLCPCQLCRLVKQHQNITKLIDRRGKLDEKQTGLIERRAVLQWKPEPPPEPERAA